MLFRWENTTNGRHSQQKVFKEWGYQAFCSSYEALHLSEMLFNIKQSRNNELNANEANHVGFKSSKVFMENILTLTNFFFKS